MTKHRRSSLTLGLTLLVSVAYCATVSEDFPPTPDNWGDAELIAGEQESFRPHVAMDPDGNAVAVWDEDILRDSHEDIWASRYTPSGGWSTPEPIRRDRESAATYGRVAMDAAGNAVVVWHEKSDDTHTFSVWSSRYEATVGWGIAQPIEDDVGNALFPQVAVNADGNAVAVWHQSDNIWSNYYTGSTGQWDGAPQLVNNMEGRALFPQVAVDGDGNAVAVWHQSEGTRFDIWSNRYEATVGWGTARLIETDNEGDAKHPMVAMDGDGNAVAVWHQSDGERFDIWSNRYEATVGWGTAELIPTDGAGDAKHPQVAMNAQGRAVAVWELSYGPSVDIHSSHYRATAGWSTSERIEANDEGGSLKPKVAVDAEGNAVAVWTQADADGINDSVWANRYDAATGWWGTAGPIEEYDEGNAWLPQLAIDSNGNAVAVWVEGEAEFGKIWSNRLEQP